MKVLNLCTKIVLKTWEAHAAPDSPCPADMYKQPLFTPGRLKRTPCKPLSADQTSFSARRLFWKDGEEWLATQAHEYMNYGVPIRSPLSCPFPTLYLVSGKVVHYTAKNRIKRCHDTNGLPIYLLTQFGRFMHCRDQTPPMVQLWQGATIGIVNTSKQLIN